MKRNSVFEDWLVYYDIVKANVWREIEDIDIYDCNLARIVSNCYSPGDLVLEAGCGTGRFCFWLSRRKIKPIGVDFIPMNIKGANHYAKSHTIDTSFIVCDVCHLPLKSNTFDGYMSLGVIEHFRSKADLLQSLDECKRILKPSAKAIITVPNIFVPLTHRTLLCLSRGTMGFFHEPYFVKDLYLLGQTIGSNIKVVVFDLWLPLFNVLAIILGKLGFKAGLLRSIKYAFAKLPQNIPLLRNILGYICLIVQKE